MPYPQFATSPKPNARIDVAFYNKVSKTQWYVFPATSLAFVLSSCTQRYNPLRRADQYQQLPLGLLNAAQGHPMLVELKNGETLNGHLVTCDTWMNLTLKEVVQTSPVRYTGWLCTGPFHDDWMLFRPAYNCNQTILTFINRMATSSSDYLKYMWRGTMYVSATSLSSNASD